MRKILVIIGMLLLASVGAILLLALAVFTSLFASVFGDWGALFGDWSPLSGSHNANPLFIVLLVTAIVGGFVSIMVLCFRASPNASERDASSPKNVLSSSGAASSTDISPGGASTPAAPHASRPILEASDIRKSVVTASESQTRIALADQVSVTTFFNAIRYGQTEVIRRAVRASPLIVLAHDLHGKTPLDVAKEEGNLELIAFFSACLAKV